MGAFWKGGPCSQKLGRFHTLKENEAERNAGWTKTAVDRGGRRGAAGREWGDVTVRKEDRAGDRSSNKARNLKRRLELSKILTAS